MSRQGDVARQWFVPGEGIDRHVISTDIQRYLGNDATVRPGVGTAENQGVQGYWIKAYRNLTSAMISDLRSDSQRWRQEQRQTGAGGSYEGSRTYGQSNAAQISQRRDRDSPSLDEYGAPMPRQGDGRQVRPMDPMQVDSPAGPGPRGQYFPPPDNRGGYGQDPNRPFPAQGRGQGGYMPDQAMIDTYGQPDNYGRFQVNHQPQERQPQGYRPNPQNPPPGYAREGQYYVPMTTGPYGPPGMMATAGAEPRYDNYGQQPQPGNQRGGAQRDPNYDPNYGAYPSPAQTIPDIDPRGRPPQPGGFPGQQPQQLDRYGNPIPNPGYQQQYPQDPGYQQPPPQPQARDPNYGRQAPAPAPAREGDRRHRRNG